MKFRTLSMVGILIFGGIGLTVSSAAATDGPLANATVSFGEWKSDFSPPLDRIVGDPAMGAGNNHELNPQIATIKAGGSVNFIISGGHVVAIYDNGTQPEDISLGNTEPASTCATTAGGVLSDSNKRIYRGPCFTGRRDGAEVVQFAKPGTYLVICARKDHFFNPATRDFEMFGFVKVLPGK
jgi:hypothetical protein